MTKLDPATILLVEDDPADQKLIRLSLKSQRLANEVASVSSGEEAFAFLRCTGDYAASGGHPDLILLDLNMPGMGGKEFLRRMKLDDSLKHIPVVILTTSDAEEDILDSYKLQASGYVRKPVKLEDFKKVMESIEAYWFLLCKRPRREA
jgi:two-component system, chemotaxis family, response regulator Rcp1